MFTLVFSCLLPTPERRRVTSASSTPAGARLDAALEVLVAVHGALEARRCCWVSPAMPRCDWCMEESGVRDWSPRGAANSCTEDRPRLACSSALATLPPPPKDTWLYMLFMLRLCMSPADATLLLLETTCPTILFDRCISWISSFCCLRMRSDDSSEPFNES